MKSLHSASFQRVIQRVRIFALNLQNRTGNDHGRWFGPEKTGQDFPHRFFKPVARIIPRNEDGTIIINVLRDNKGKDIGSTNFIINVPYAAMVDIETVVGDLEVRKTYRVGL